MATESLSLSSSFQSTVSDDVDKEGIFLGMIGGKELQLDLFML